MLENAEARDLLGMYRLRVKQHGKVTANQWLEEALQRSEKWYGRGSADRIRSYMRKHFDGEHQ